MRNVNPLKLAAEGSDLYRLYCQNKEGAEVCFSFQMSWNGTKEDPYRSIDHEDAYYFVTYDDPEGNTIERCIHCFDRARRERRESTSTALVPECIRIEPTANPDNFRYTVIAGSAAGQKEHVVQISENANIRNCRWEFGATDAALDLKGFWNTPQDADPLLQAILLLHQAIHTKYSMESIPQ